MCWATIRKQFLNSFKSHNYAWCYCPMCNGAIRKSQCDVDHIIPKSKHGPDSSWNLRVSCPSCNRSKKDSVGFHTLTDLLNNNPKANAIVTFAAEVAGGVALNLMGSWLGKKFSGESQ